MQNYTYGTPYPNHPLLTLTQWNGALQPTTLLTIEYSAYIYNAQGSAGGDDIGGNDSWNILQGDPTDVYGGNDWLRGFAGNDTIYGVGGSDLIEGGDNNDQLYGDWDTEAQDQGNFGTGDDTVDGGAGDDSIWSDAGQNVLIGGQHRDTVIYSGFFDTGVTYYHAVINLQAGTAAVSATDTYSGDEYQVASDSLSGFEHVLGTDGDDIIIGYAAEPYSGAWISLDGRYGNDSLVGGTGGEDLMGGAGNDTLVCGDVAGARALGDYLAGGAGNDTYVLTADAIIDEYNYGGGGVDTLVLGYAATDFALLEGALEHLVMQTGAGAAPVTGNTAANSMTGNSFGNWMSGLAGADTLTGGNGADSLYGGLNRDTLWGGNGNDVVAGGGDHDYLSGGAGNDTLNGSSGNDTLVGNTGRDFMTGGVGRDLFVFKNGADGGTGTAADRITDFVSGEDRISLKDVCRADYFIGPDVFGGRAGEWRYLDTTGQLQADIDGNGRADFVVNLGAGTVLLASDLIL